MAKLKIKNLRQVETRLRLKVTKALRSPEIKSGVAEIVVDEIQKDTSTAGKTTQKFREYLEKGNTTDKKYKRSKINITFTGDLLKDLINNVKADFKKGKSQYILEHSSKKHKKYRKPDGKLMKGKAKTHKEISGYVQDLGYNYLSFSDKTQLRVIKFIKNALFKNLK